MIRGSHLTIEESCEILELNPRRYYRWSKKEKEFGMEGLQDKRPGPTRPMNRILPEEEDAILDVAREYPDLRHKKLVPKLADKKEVSVSASTVYRVLKEHDLINSWELTKPTGEEFDKKTEGPNELWQIDICYIPIQGQTCWYLISVLDDYSRKIMNHELCWSMTADDVLRVIDEAMLEYELCEDPPKFLTDNGTQMTSNKFKEYVGDLEITHLRTAFNHPETIGKIERYHRTVKYEDVFPKGYQDPFKAREGIAEFIRYYNQERPHEALNYVTPEEKYQGLDEEIIKKREKLKEKTLRKRKKINKMKEAVLE